MRPGNCVFRFILLATLAALAALPAWAQSSNGSVRGSVQDQTNAVIPGATVALTNTATNIESRTTTNEAGIYAFPAVIPGPYTLAVESPGMRKFEGNLTVRVQQSETVNVTLYPATTATVVSVEDITPIVTADSQSLGQVLERTRIEQLPINGRQVMNLLYTVPGLTFDTDSNLRTFGAREGTHDISLDGAALSEPVYSGGTVRRQPSLESIQEFKVDLNAASAKYARQTNIIMTTKSGTNDLHGSLFETNRDNYYGLARRREDGNVPGKFIRNEYGGTVGGPVWIPKIYDGKNRTFFFFAYEGYKQRSGTTGGYRVPTEAMRKGDFRGLVDSKGTLSKIYDPFQTDPVTKLRPQFAYQGVPNTIDPNKISPLFKYLADVLPMPTLPNVNPLVANNYYGPKAVVNDQWTWSVRVDQRIGERDQVYGRWSDSYFQQFQGANRGVPTIDDGGNSRNDWWPNKSLALNWTHSFSPTFFNEAGFSVSRSPGGMFTGKKSQYWADMLGLPNPNHQPGFPVISTMGIGSGNYIQPVNAREQWFTFFILDDNATKIIGRHEIQFGAHLRYDQLNMLPQQQRQAGNVSWRAIGTALYDPAFPNRSQAVKNTGHALASAYLGLADYEYRVNKGRYYIRQNEDAAYIQDNFKVSPRLTVMGGLRWQFSPYPKDKYDIFSGFDLKSMSIVLGNSLDTFYKVGATSPALIAALQENGAKFVYPKDVGLPKRLLNNNWFDIGPHIGFAYRAFDGPKSFVVRGGFSTSYFPVPIYGWNDRMRNNSPFTGFYANPWMTSAASSPDGIQNYGLVSVPTWIAGKNTRDAINLSQLNRSTIGVGGDAYQAAYFNPDQPTSRVHDWNLTIEKEVMPDTVVRVAYTGNRQTHQDTYDDLNQMIPEYVWYMTRREPWPGGDFADALTRPYSNTPYGDIQEFRKDGWGNAHGGTIEIQRRYSKGYGFQVFYQMINSARAGGHGWYEESMVNPVTSYLPGVVPQDRKERMQLLLYKRDTMIPKHEIRWNWIVDLPFGQGKPLLGNAPKVLDYAIGGWQVTGMGRLRSHYFNLPTDIWPTGPNVEFYGHKYPIQDCTSGQCQAGWLLWNAYIPAHQINKPDGIMGVPSSYKPAGQPLWPYPANYASLNEDNDPNYGYYGTNIVFIPLKDGSTMEIDKGDLHPWRNQPVMSTRTWTTDASIFKTFKFTERMGLRIQADFFNVFNRPENDPYPNSYGIVLQDHSFNDPRQLQLTARFSW